MACSGAHCSNHGTGTTTCSNHRGACETNRQLSFSDFVEGGVIYASYVEELRTKIREEVAAFDAHANYAYGLLLPDAITAGQLITNEVYNGLNDMIRQIYGDNIDIGDGATIDDYQLDVLIGYYNIARKNCICNADCSCNNVCSCHNDCGCNY